MKTPKTIDEEVKDAKNMFSSRFEQEWEDMKKGVPSLVDKNGRCHPLDEETLKRICEGFYTIGRNVTIEFTMNTLKNKIKQ